jgi:uncharacterized protein (TIGR03083 family)
MDTAPSAPGQQTTDLDFAGRVTAIRTATTRMLGHLEAVGFGAAVPTCPEWTTRELTGHLGMVHRWATHIVANRVTDRPDFTPERAPEGHLTEWFAAGSAALIEALEQAPDDLQALVFLKGAPAPKDFWARRQAHETTIHGVDALAARLGRLPTTKEADLPIAVAVDGLDELLTGFLPRRSSELRAETPLTFVVAPADADVGWTVRLSDDPPVTTRADPSGSGTADTVDAVMTGSAASLYLGLTNRGDEIAVTGEPELLGVWRDKVRIRWS